MPDTTTAIRPDFYTSNGLKIPFTPQYFEELKPASISDKNALVAQFERDGYVYLKSFLNRDSVFDLRELYMQQFDDVIFKEGTSRREGIFSGKLQYRPSEHGLPHHPAAQFVKNSQFIAFTHNPRLRAVAELLMQGADVVQLKRKPLRHFYKGTNVSSRAHSDYTYLNDGTDNVLTLWIPLGDIPMECGGLLYLKGSDKLDLSMLRETVKREGEQPTDDRPIANDLKEVSDITGCPWLYTDFKAGDIVLHNPYIVHASLDCNSDAMRLSTDVRFADINGRIDARWLDDWRGDDGY